MARSRSKRPDLKDLYKRVRKPMPPPAKVEPDRRRRLRNQEAQKEAQQGVREEADEDSREVDR